METPLALQHEVWERTPPEAQASIRALEAHLEASETMVQALQEHNHALQEQLSTTSRNSSRPPSSNPADNTHIPGVLGVNAITAINRGTLAILPPQSQ